MNTGTSNDEGTYVYFSLKHPVYLQIQVFFYLQIQSNLSRSPKPQYFPSTMLPPPPLPPMARPVAIIRSTCDVNMSGTNSPPASITPPCSEASPADEVPEINSSPPLSPGSHDMRKSPSQRNSVPTSSPYSPSREYSFNHFHGQPGHVGIKYCCPKEDYCRLTPKLLLANV